MKTTVTSQTTVLQLQYKITAPHPSASAASKLKRAVRRLTGYKSGVNPLHTELNPTCHLLALLGAHHILHVRELRVNTILYWHYSHNDTSLFQSHKH
jgi:hypothetical protein